MSIILKPIFDYLIRDLSLFDDLILDTIFLTIIGFIAFQMAFKIVGFLFNIGFLRDSDSGSFFHWSIRLVCFVLIFKLLSYLIYIVKLIFLIPFWVWLSLVFLVIIFYIFYFFRHSNKDNL